VQQAHVCAIMDSYNLTKASTCRRTATSTMSRKKQWAFDGIIMSDWDSTTTELPR